MTWYEQEVHRIRREHLPDEELVARLISTRRWLQQHPAGCCLDEMADRACLSKFHFIRLFKRCYGQTPHQVLTTFKMERAKNLLAEGCPVQQVCRSLGYRSVASFSTLFKREAGISPSAYVQKRNIR